MDSNFTLIAISPVDGRYYRQVADLSEYFSEKALIYYRVKIEIEYFIALCKHPLPQLVDFNNELFDHKDFYNNIYIFISFLFYVCISIFFRTLTNRETGNCRILFGFAATAS